VERLDLVLSDDHLNVGNPLRQLPNRSTAVRALLKVGPHPRPQRFRFTDVQNIPTAIPKQVDPGPSRQRFQLILKPRSHIFSLAPRPKPVASPPERELAGKARSVSPRSGRTPTRAKAQLSRGKEKAARVERPGRSEIRICHVTVEAVASFPGAPCGEELGNTTLTSVNYRSLFPPGLPLLGDLPRAGSG
jgi:hypothetical protein